jgi:dihydrofolate reductase
LKQHSGKDIAVFGSSNLSLTLIKHKLIDEFRIMVNPMVLGDGVPLFRGLGERLSLKLLKTKTFKSGNILLYCIPGQ